MENSTTTELELQFHPPWSAFESSFAICAATCVVVLSLLYKWWKNHPLYGKNPGAKVYPVVGNLPEILWNLPAIFDLTVRLMRDQQILTIRHSIPFTRTTFMTANPANVEHILKTNFENYPKGDYIQHTMHDLLGEGILNTDGELWRMQRKVSSFEFSLRSLRNFMIDNVQQEIETRLTPILSHAACSPKKTTLDLQDILKRFNFDNICALTVGVDPGCLAMDLPHLEFEQAFDGAAAGIASRYTNPLWKISRALNFGRESKLHNNITSIRSFLMSVIHNRRKETQTQQTTNQRVDLLSRFMDHADKFSDEFLCDMLVSFFQAGRDTVATGLAWFFYELTIHRNVEHNIIAEIAAIRKSNKRVNPNPNPNSKRRFSLEDLKRMHYLHAALFESMRLHPPVPCDLKVAIRDDIWPDGTVIRKGETAGYHPYAMGRMESLWGADVLDFKPERWLQNELFVAENSFKYPVFQAGPRICLGKDMGVMQLKLIAASVLERFRVAVPPGFAPLYRLSFILSMTNGLPVFVAKREEDEVCEYGR